MVLLHKIPKCILKLRSYFTIVFYDFNRKLVATILLLEQGITTSDVKYFTILMALLF
jgi:hypothetical protein